MTTKEIQELRNKGWHFQFASNGGDWWCSTVALGLAHGEGGGSTIEEAAEEAINAARAMEDDPKVLIASHGDKIEKLAKDIFGEKVFQGIEPVESAEEGEPVRIALSLAPTISPKEYIDQEMKFLHEMMSQFPVEMNRALIIEVDWPDEKAKA